MAFFAADNPCISDRQVLWVIGRWNIYWNLVANRILIQKKIMKRLFLFLIVSEFIILLLTASSVIAQETQFRRISVDNQVSIEVPAHWQIRDLDGRKNISAAVEVMTEGVSNASEANYVSALSVVSRPEPVDAIIRVSLIPIEDLSQASLNRDIQSDRAGVLRELAGLVKKDLDEMRKIMDNQGGRILGQETVGLDTIGGLTAFTLKYRRTSPTGSSPFNVTQYHVPLGKQKVIITLSYRESDGALFALILDRVKRSVVIK